MQKQPRILGVFGLAMLTIAGIFSLRNLPFMAVYGTTGLVYYVLIALLYFLPIILTCAELATAWPEDGGMYAWVREGLGDRLGFLAMWLEWTNTVVLFPVSLSYIAATVAYLSFPQLAANKLFMLTVTLVVFWLGTLVSCAGIKASARVSIVGVILGTLLPAVFIVGLGSYWLLLGHPSYLDWQGVTELPAVHVPELVLLTGVINGFAGMQVAGFHVLNVKHPGRDFPRSLIAAGIVILLLSMIGSLTIAMVVPADQLNLVAGPLQALQQFFINLGMPGMIKWVALFTLVGALAAINTWILAPARGLHASVLRGDLPRWLARENRHGMPVTILLVQAAVASLFTGVYLLMPTVNSSYWLLSALTMQLTMLMNILLFAAVIVLRLRQPRLPRPYRIPGGIFGVTLIAGIGAVTCFTAFSVGFVPPEQLQTGSLAIYDSLLLGGMLLFALPVIVQLINGRSR